MAELSEKQQELLNGPNFAVVATVGEDGSPQSTVVWVDTDGENVRFNTKRGRAKVAHLERDQRVSVTIMDRENPYSFFEVQGLASLDENGANEHINQLSNKYKGPRLHRLRGPRDRARQTRPGAGLQRRLSTS
jgi:PPOX class probable F420-dependent enzyme